MIDVVVVGGGPNGLIAAALVARRKHTTVVLEARPEIGGALASAEIAPGFHVPALAHTLGPLRRDLIKALALERAGVQWVMPDPPLATLGPDGQAIVFHRDPVFTSQSIERVSPRDAGRWREFADTLQHVAAVLSRLNRNPAPDVDAPTPRDLLRLADLGRRARGLGARNLARLMRWMPMPVADLAAEWFDADLLRGAVAARALFGHFAGPRSAGTGALLLQRVADDPCPMGSGVTVAGGPGALARALQGAAERAGAQVRTGARVAQILTRSGAVSGVVLSTGETIEARAVVSAVDPRQTMLSLVEPDALPPSFLQRVRQVRARGVTAKVNLALSSLPRVPALDDHAQPLRGHLLVAPGLDYLERAFDAAKYGRFSPEPWLEAAIPSVLDPSIAPEGSHVMSIYVHAAPRVLREGTWNEAREPLFRAVLAALAPSMPDLERLVVARQVLTPEDLEREWGYPGGHVFHGELALDQWWSARPLLGWAGHTTPVKGLYLCSAGTHPGGGITGGPAMLAAEVVARGLRGGGA